MRYCVHIEMSSFCGCGSDHSFIGTVVAHWSRDGWHCLILFLLLLLQVGQARAISRGELLQLRSVNSCIF